jgi:hypothetical protein
MEPYDPFLAVMNKIGIIEGNRLRRKGRRARRQQRRWSSNRSGDGLA